MSNFLRIMQRGHRKVRYSKRNGRLLMALSNEQHVQIARVIQQWLTADESRKRSPPLNKSKHQLK
ncbi:hypothetical protein [Alteromonas sp. AMM-1]|uniref:hypothetical protein n=1 Tax=Alteromonas sp. AMM-1 TaxID=3394233 RepID=UPI0039A74876